MFGAGGRHAMTVEALPRRASTRGAPVAKDTGPPLLIISREGRRAIATGPAVFEISRAVASERGRFATSSWHWDGITLRAETSPRGLVALYYAALPDRFIISPSIRKVIDAIGRVSDRPTGDAPLPSPLPLCRWHYALCPHPGPAARCVADMERANQTECQPTRGRPAG